MRPDAAEQRRQKGNLQRFATVSEVDYGTKRCRVASGEIVSDWIPWFAPRAGKTIEWSAPSVGEQGMVLSPDGDTSGGVFLRGIYSDSFDAPEVGEHVHLVRFPDGSQVRYDDEAHALQLTIAEGGTVEVTAAGGVTINADVQVNGDINLTGTATADVDVIADGISLKHHVHTGVTAGIADSGPPKP